MQDEMTITVIAAGFDMHDPDALEEEEEEEPIQVDNPLVDDVKVSGRSAVEPAKQPQPKTTQSDMDDSDSNFPDLRPKIRLNRYGVTLTDASGSFCGKWRGN